MADSDERAPKHDEGRPSSAPPFDEERLRDRLQALLPDVLKRAVQAGVGAMTGEESIRKVASELPKEVAGYLMQQASSSKDELYRIIGQVFSEWLDRLNLHEEMVKVLTSVSFEIKTEVRLIPNEAGTGVKSEVKRKVSVKRGARDKDKDAKDAKPDEPEEEG